MGGRARAVRRREYDGVVQRAGRASLLAADGVEFNLLSRGWPPPPSRPARRYALVASTPHSPVLCLQHSSGVWKEGACALPSTGLRPKRQNGLANRQACTAPHSARPPPDFFFCPSNMCPTIESRSQNQPQPILVH